MQKAEITLLKDSLKYGFKIEEHISYSVVLGVDVLNSSMRLKENKQTLNESTNACVILRYLLELYCN